MFEAFVAGAIGTVAAILGWAVARRIGPSGTTRHRATLLSSFVSFFTLGSATLMPHARAWKQERDVLTLLRDDPVFAAVLAEEPARREPLRAALLEAMREGAPGEAAVAGLRFLSPQLWHSVPGATDAAAVGLGRALVERLTDLQARNPEDCYRFLFPSVAGPPAGGGSTRDEGLLLALRTAALSARTGTAEPLDRRTAARQVETAFGHLRERHGDAIDVLRRPEAAEVDRALVCAMTIALYSELLALPPGPAGQALRHALGPGEPAGPAR